MKTVLLIPGFYEDLHDRDYASTITAIEQKGYAVVFVPIHWKRTTIEQWVHEFNEVYTHYQANDTIIAGFSFGAFTAFIAAIDRNPSQLWLFSLSPFFREDIESEGMKKAWLRTIGHRRVSTFYKHQFVDLQKKLLTKTVYFYGDLELKVWPDISYRTKALKNNKNSQIVIAHGAGHDITNEAYIKTIVAAI